MESSYFSFCHTFFFFFARAEEINSAFNKIKSVFSSMLCFFIITLQQPSGVFQDTVMEHKQPFPSSTPAQIPTGPQRSRGDAKCRVGEGGWAGGRASTPFFAGEVTPAIRDPTRQ